ncbi:alpha-L-fucosidase [Haloferula sp. A504]|uniref:alpha-L-fucosidase n=1 Tax=Haloferula sp. A504 TaxID=3373601 RepID=UPI0031BD51FA|nr:alpha-L-fucosidase [Verrucomicrobiaceae bacterium E54]
MKKIIKSIFPILCVLAGAMTAALSAAAAPAPFPPTPNPAQLKWHKAEQLMFVHFGMKTFYPSDNHMGSGREDPKKFNPVHFDADQWVAAAKAGGFKGIVLTTKHHDGFCNWPTKTTDHCVRSSSWKDGKGDIVRELVEACRKGGIYFGFYVSILDHNYNLHGSDKFDNYGDFYHEQIKELSTEYGPIDEYWFDGFCSEELRVPYEKIAELIRTAQPHAVVYDSNTLVKYLPDRCLRWAGTHGGLGADQNYRVEVDGALRWYPNEPSLILQGNWFYDGKPIKSLEEIQEDYLTTVGNGVTPLMNVAPNQDGLIDEASVARLKEYKAWVDALHANDLANGEGVRVTASSVRGDDPTFAADRAIDGDYETYFATDDGVTEATIEINLGRLQEIDGFILQEYIPLGQRVDGFAIECFVDGDWKTVFEGQRIGYKRILLEGRASAKEQEFPATDRVRLRIENAMACPLISSFQVIGGME